MDRSGGSANIFLEKAQNLCDYFRGQSVENAVKGLGQEKGNAPARE